MPDQVSFVTPEGLKRIERELETLRRVQRPKIIQQLQEALEQASAQASPLENPDYAVVKNEQAFVEGRILHLELILKTAVLIQEPTTHDVVSLGSKVTITELPDGAPEHYHVVGSVEADPLHGFISNESPLGRALIGCKVDDVITVQAPDGELAFRIQAVD